MDVNITEKYDKSKYIIDVNGTEICTCSTRVVADYIQELILHDFDFNTEDYKVTMLQKLQGE